MKAGDSVEVERLTDANVAQLTNDVMKYFSGKDAIQFFSDRWNCECKERKYCYRLSCDPVFLYVPLRIEFLIAGEGEKETPSDPF